MAYVSHINILGSHVIDKIMPDLIVSQPTDEYSLVAECGNGYSCRCSRSSGHCPIVICKKFSPASRQRSNFEEIIKTGKPDADNFCHENTL
jgi:hypothetical protein